MENNNAIVNLEISPRYEFLPDFEMKYTEEELDEISEQLSAEDESIFNEIMELQKQNDGKSDFMKELLEATKKGTLEYLDSMTDTGDTFSAKKRSDDVSRWDSEEIAPINTSANKEEADAFRPRTMADANKSAIRNPVTFTEGMSEAGKERFKRYEKAYSQRTKSLNQISTENNSIKTSDAKTNMDTLSGLRGYRIGPVVAMPTAEQAKERYDNYVKEHPDTNKNASNWLYDQNMHDFDAQLAKELGFSSVSKASEWRRQNKLTVHEGPDGMFLVPSDVHSAARHNGYRSMMSKYIKGEITKEEMNSYVRQEKIAFVKHEAQERGVRMVKGIGMAALKDVLKCSIVVICKETYSEFSETREEKFVERMMRIFKNSWEHVKAKCEHILKNLWKNIKGSIFSELLTAINDFFFRTFKNIFKIVRQMWSSIKSAFKIIFSKDKNITFAERMFEASKILSAGVVGIIGFSLNELIEKSLTTIGIPFASFIAECFSGLFAGIMSAIVIMLFDKLKKDFTTRSIAVQQLQLQSRSMCVHSAQLSISSLQVDLKMKETYNFVGNVFLSIETTRQHINEQKSLSGALTETLNAEVALQDERLKKLQALKDKYDDPNF